MLKLSWLRLPFLTLALILSNQLIKPETAQAHHNAVHSTAEAAVEQSSPTETLSLIGLGAVIALGFTAFLGTQLVGQKR
jgi:ATP-dependent Zn protease